VAAVNRGPLRALARGSEFWEEEIEVNVATVVRTAGASALLLTLASCYDDNANYGPPPVLTVPNSIAIADVNGDGANDLLLATTIDQGTFLNPGEANVILGKKSPAGSFMTAVSYPTTGPNPSSIAVANLGAGGLDLVVANYGSGSVTVFMHGPSGTFQAGKDISTGGSPNQVAVKALNGGNPDIVVADASTNGNVVILWHGAVAGTFQTPPVVLPVGVTVSGVTIWDIDGDGLQDIVASTYDSNGNNGAVYVFYQGPAGTFSGPVPVQYQYPAGAQPQTVRVANLRGTGANDNDLVVANLGPGTDGTGSAGVSVLLQSGPRTFAPPMTYQTGGGTVDVQAASLTGGPLPDIVTANLGPAPSGSVSVLLNAGDGTFKPATNYPSAAQPLAVAIGDLGNGIPDIAVADSPTALVLMQSTTSRGTFAAPVQVGQ
jgi:hypothetical protein